MNSLFESRTCVDFEQGKCNLFMLTFVYRGRKERIRFSTDSELGPKSIQKTFPSVVFSIVSLFHLLGEIVGKKYIISSINSNIEVLFSHGKSNFFISYIVRLCQIVSLRELAFL